MLVAAGGALGALARYGVVTAWAKHGTYAWPVLVINVVGAFVLGLLLEGLTRRGADVGGRRRLRLLVGTGFCGAFTTYSTFARDVTTLGRHHVVSALGWGLGELLIGIAATAGGVFVAARTAPGAGDGRIP